MKTGFITIDWEEDAYKAVRLRVGRGFVDETQFIFASGDPCRDFLAANTKASDLMEAGEMAHCSYSSTIDEFPCAVDGYKWGIISLKDGVPILSVNWADDFHSLPEEYMEVLVPASFEGTYEDFQRAYGAESSIDE